MIDRHRNIQPLPKKVEAFAGLRVVAVSAGAYHSLAISTDGAVFAWGKGDHGCLVRRCIIHFMPPLHIRICNGGIK